MRLRLYHVDAFTDRPFAGNPAAVVPLAGWLDDDLLLSIAAENNLPETAFFVPQEQGRYGLRWFTPEAEVKLCGHATLATALILFDEFDPERTELRFDTLSGELVVTRQGERLVMNFPCWSLERQQAAPSALREALGVEPVEVLMTVGKDNLFAVLEAEADVASLQPDMRTLATLHPAGVAVTAPSARADFVVRYFAPSYGIDEDPGTGSIQCGLVPYWSARLGKTTLHSLQISRRGSEFHSELRDGRTLISGRAARYMEGWIDF